MLVRGVEKLRPLLSPLTRCMAYASAAAGPARERSERWSTDFVQRGTKAEVRNEPFHPPDMLGCPRCKVDGGG